MQTDLQRWMLPFLRVVGVTASAVNACLIAEVMPADAQVTSALDGTGTTVVQDGDRFDITDGTQAGANLFHNFEALSVEDNQTVNFLPDASVLNIVGQVSGPNPSYIEGRVQVQANSDANLYLINPQGVLFGPEAQLSLSGSMVATTADQIGFGDAWLDVLHSGSDYTNLTATPSAFRFTADSASAVVNQGDLSVQAGESLLMMGGNVVSEGQLAASGGEIGLVAVGGESTVRFGVPGSLLSLEIAEQDFDATVGSMFSPTELPALLTGESGVGTEAIATGLVVTVDNQTFLTGTQIESEEVAVTGAISTSSEDADGGVIALVGRSVDVLSSTLEASGNNGGTIRIGSSSVSESLPASEFVLLRDNPLIHTEGRQGAGGDIVVNAVNNAIETATISAAGQTQGGSIETSATGGLGIVSEAIDASGQLNSGRWLLSAPGIEITDNPSVFPRIVPSAIENALGSGIDIRINALDQGIALSRSINQIGSSEASLTLSGQSFRTNGSTISLESTGQLAFEINPGSSAGGDSVQAAIAATGNVQGPRLLSLNEGIYEFSDTTVINTDIDIVGATTGQTILQATENVRVFTVLPSVTTNFQDLSFKIPEGTPDSFIGGGVENFGTLNVSNSTFENNRGVFGGAIHNRASGRLTVGNSEFSGNRATLDGGAIQSFGGVVDIFDTTLKENVADDDGGGFYASNGGSASLLNVVVEGNQAGDGGGGLYHSGDSDITVTGSVIRRNRAGDEGGGILNNSTDGVLTVINTDFEENSAIAGGALYSRANSLVSITDSNFVGNEARGSNGGALYADEGAAFNATGSTFEENRAADQGGAIAYAAAGDFEIAGSRFARNEAVSDGGAIANNSSLGTLDIQDSQFVENISEEDGGAIFSGRDGSATVTNSTFIRNQAINGGGLFQSAGMLSVAAGRFEDNGASDMGGGIALVGNVSANLRDNTLVFGNQAGRDGGGLGTTSAGDLTVQQSFIGDNFAGADGGGLSLSGNGEVAVSTSEISRNEAGRNGGGVFLGDRTRLNITGATFNDNKAGQSGGAVYQADESVFSVEQVSISGNRAEINGGAIANESTTGLLSLFEIGLVNNTAGESGGGIYSIANSQVAITTAGLVNNTAETGDGGGIYIGEVAETVVNQITLSNNAAGRSGGGLFNSGTASLAASTLAGNRAASGGAVANTGTLEAVNVTLSGNQASNAGGGIATTGQAANLLLRNSTLTNNSAASSGGIRESESQSTQLLNTIVAGNNSPVAADVSGRFVDEGYNLIGQRNGAVGFTQSTLVGTAANPLDPGLAPLAINDGVNETHLLQADSFAINAGGSDRLPMTDQRGLARQVGASVDIGAVEASAAEVPDTPPADPQPPIEPVAEPVAPTSEVSDSVRLAVSQLESLFSESSNASRHLPQARPSAQENSDDVEVRKVERAFGQSFEDYWDLPDGKDLSFREVQTILRRAQDEYQVNSAVVYAMFVPDEEAEAAAENPNILQTASAPSGDDLLQLLLVMPEGELERYQLPVTRREANRQVRLFRSNVSDIEDSFGYRPLAQQLYQWLLAPLEEDLAAQGIQNLLYSLDTGLRTAPVTAMSDYNGFSIERYGISVVSTMGLTQTDFPLRSRRPTVAMGVATFADEEPLPAVPIELAVVEDYVPAAQTALNEGTTRDALNAIQASAQPGVLHLATHATFDQHSPESSHIHLWEDSLSMADFSDIDWLGSDLELLILSACSTALSSTNAELGFAGLATAAGVDATVGSLWQVSDIGTLALMSEFYIQLEQSDLRFEALRRAQLALLNGETRIENGNLLTSGGVVDLPDDWDLPENAALDHPFFWSAFTMVGNPW